MAVTFVSSTGLHKYVQIALLRTKCDTQTEEQMLKKSRSYIVDESQIVIYRLLRSFFRAGGFQLFISAGNK